jgi:benzoate 4-monooxygenase
VWGDDATLFRPERWLDPDKKADPNDFMPFGAGHRSCVGRNIAMMSIVKVLATVWRRYELKPVDCEENLVVESVGVGEKKGALLVTAMKRA